MYKTYFTFLALAVSSVYAQTTFDDGDATDSYIENALNWDNGAPSAVNPGTISIDANLGLQTGSPMTNWVVTQTAGAITPGSFPNLSFAISGGSWTMDGGTMQHRSHSTSNGAVFTMNNAASSVTTVNNSAISVDGSGSQFILNNGTVNADRGIRTIDGGELIVNGGTINSDTNDAFLGNGFSGDANATFNGGTTTAGRLTFQGGSDLVTFGGSTVGSASFTDWGVDDNSDRQEDDNITIDFLQGSQMTMSMGAGTRALVLGTVTQTDAWAEALWNTDQLLYNGFSSTGLGGLSWADASNSSVGVGNGEYFLFTPDGSFGGSLALAAIPEPSSIALMGVAGLAMFAFARKRRS